MVSVNVNGIEILVKPGVSILEACKYAGLNLPRFCYHEVLSVSGNCRMCLVEVEALEKPVASCVTEVTDGMIVYVDSPFVKKARENVVETLLLNHPLDCPICDQAGECDLQDQTKTFGANHSRYFFNKKGVEDKYCGPLIKTIMTRCISCTRCVRFSTEVAGVDFFGTLNRGGSTEIGSYVSKMFQSEISGNVIDLCPVGALTSKPYAFRTRPWELRLSESVDITDSLGSNIYVNYKEAEIFRVLPKNNSEVNGSLISDKARFSYDTTIKNRLNKIFIKSDNKNFIKGTWSDFLKKVDTYVKESSLINFYINDKCDFETMLILKKLTNAFPNIIKTHLVNTTSLSVNNFFISSQKHIMSDIDNLSSVAFLFGVNTRLESSILNSRLRAKVIHDPVDVQVIGTSFDLNMPSSFVSLNLSKGLSIFEGKVEKLSLSLFGAKNPYILIGENVFDRTFGNVKNITEKLTATFSSLKVLYLTNNRNSEGASWLSHNVFSNKVNKLKNSLSIFINLEENIFIKNILSESNKKVWINTHGSSCASESDLIVPMLTPYESEEMHLNVEHRFQKTYKSVTSSVNSRSVKDIVSSIFETNLPVSQSISNLLELSAHPELYTTLKDQNSFIDIVKNSGSSVIISKYPIKQKIKDFYCTDNLTKNSILMQNCSNETIKVSKNFYQ
jgi:NADH dehydrogenase (ubiquinone) Fe-S protein 1